MPAIPSWLLEPLWDQFAALLPDRPAYHPSHPLGCHKPRIADRIIFEKLIQVLRFGCSYASIADCTCGAPTIRDRRTEWIKDGIFADLKTIARESYDRIVGLALADIAVDGCIAKAPGGGDCAGPSPVDRRKQGMKRSLMVEGRGIPLGRALAPANRHDSPLLAPTLEAAGRQLDGILPQHRTCHLDRGYDSTVTRQLLGELGFEGQIARKGVPAPVQAGTRWVVERTHAWMNGYGKLRRCTERAAAVVDFYLYLAAAIVTIRQIIQRARTRYRWDTRPTTKRLK